MVTCARQQETVQVYKTTVGIADKFRRFWTVLKESRPSENAAWHG